MRSVHHPTLDTIKNARNSLAALSGHADQRVRAAAAAASDALAISASAYNQLHGLIADAESFISGFEDDESQAGVDLLLQRLRDAPAIEGTF